MLLSSDEASSDRLCLTVVLKYPTQHDPTLTSCAVFFDKLTFGSEQTAVLNANNKPYISTSQDTQFHFKSNFFANCQGTAPDIEFAAVSFNTNLAAIDCHHRGTCDIPDSSCEVTIMHCETTGANPECVSLHGFRKTYTAVQDKNGVATNRVDVS